MNITKANRKFRHIEKTLTRGKRKRSFGKGWVVQAPTPFQVAQMEADVTNTRKLVGTLSRTGR